MRREVRLLLQDIAGAITKIDSFTSGFTFETYTKDDRTRSAVERQFIIIGEAIRRIHHQSAEASQRIDNAIRIAGFRNILVHEYEQVDDGEVWRVIHGSLPRLKHQIDAWAAELGMTAPPEAAS